MATKKKKSTKTTATPKTPKLALRHYPARFTEAQWTAIKSCAASNSLPVSAVVRTAVATFLGVADPTIEAGPTR